MLDRPYTHPAFYWVIPGRLAGTSQPGAYWGGKKRFEPEVTQVPAWEAEAQAASMQQEGIKSVLSVRGVLPEWVQRLYDKHGMQYHHVPVSHDGAPRSTQECDAMLDWLKEHQPAAVHCLHGIGRTGTVLAAWLIRESAQTAPSAMARIRELRGGAIETEAQEEFLHTYERHCARKS